MSSRAFHRLILCIMLSNFANVCHALIIIYILYSSHIQSCILDTTGHSVESSYTAEILYVKLRRGCHSIPGFGESQRSDPPQSTFSICHHHIRWEYLFKTKYILGPGVKITILCTDIFGPSVFILQLWMWQEHKHDDDELLNNICRSFKCLDQCLTNQIDNPMRLDLF